MLLWCFTPPFDTFLVFFKYSLMQSSDFGWFEWVSLLIRMVWSYIDRIFPPSSTCPIKPLLMQVIDSLPTDAPQTLHCIIAAIDGTYPIATIQAYFSDFVTFVTFCELNNQSALLTNAVITADFIHHISASRKSSPSIRGAVAISDVHLLNRLSDPTKDSAVRIAMKRMHCTLRRSTNQTYDYWKDMITLFLANLGHSIRGLRDAAVLQIA